MSKNKVIFEIEQNAYEQIYQALKEFGSYEIGGMLIGYKKGYNHFCISNATVADDAEGFGVFSFIREPFKSIKVLMQLFNQRKHNYIGEWHSHPQFRLVPSRTDVETMKGILTDTEYGVNFVLLLITKLKKGEVDVAGFLFHKRLPVFVEAALSNSSR